MYLVYAALYVWLVKITNWRTDGHTTDKMLKSEYLLLLISFGIKIMIFFSVLVLQKITIVAALALSLTKASHKKGLAVSDGDRRHRRCGDEKVFNNVHWWWVFRVVIYSQDMNFFILILKTFFFVRYDATYIELHYHAISSYLKWIF